MTHVESEHNFENCLSREYQLGWTLSIDLVRQGSVSLHSFVVRSLDANALA